VPTISILSSSQKSCAIINPSGGRQRRRVVAIRRDERARLVLDRYIAAFEQSDMAAIERLLADNAILEMTGTATWFSGKATCVPFIAAQAIGQAGDWRMVPLHANGQLAVAAYHLGDGGSYHPFAIVVVTTTLTHLTRISLFAEPAPFARFGLPPTISAGPRPGTGP
jgi:RNA polymerase sigma-70 factor (ECF subfamily)